TAHQAQHGRNLSATASPFGGGNQMIDGADQNRCGNQITNIWILIQPPQNRVSIKVAIESDVSILLHQALGRGRSCALSLLFIVLEQRPAGAAAHSYRQLIFTEVKALTIGLPGLQSQGTQAQ